MEPPMNSHLTWSKSQNPYNGWKRPTQSDLISNYVFLSSLCSSQTALLCCCSWDRTDPSLPQGFVLAFFSTWVTLPLDILLAYSLTIVGSLCNSHHLCEAFLAPLKMSSSPPRPQSYSSFITSYFSLAHKIIYPTVSGMHERQIPVWHKGGQK